MDIVGMEVEELPKGWMPHGVIVIFRCMDQNGLNQLAMRVSPDWSTWEAAGALQVFATSILSDFQTTLSDDDPT